MRVAAYEGVHDDLRSVTVMRACLSRALHPVSNSGGCQPLSGSQAGGKVGARGRVDSLGSRLGSAGIGGNVSRWDHPRMHPRTHPQTDPRDRSRDSWPDNPSDPPSGPPSGSPSGPGEASDVRPKVGRRSTVSVVAEHVLLTTDGSALAGRAVPMAIAAIEACASERVSVLRVLTHPGEGTRPVQALEWELARAHAEADLRRVVNQLAPDAGADARVAARVEPQRLERASAPSIESIVAEGRAADQILHFIESSAVDLVVMAAHGSDDARGWPMGSVARKVIASGQASVLIVPSVPGGDAEPEAAPIRRVLVPLDCSARAECVLPLIHKLADAHAPEFVLVHVVPRPDLPHRLPAGTRDRELIDELTHRSRQRAEVYLHTVRERLVSRGAKVEVVLAIDDHPARTIEQLALSSAADLIVLSAHGSGADVRDAYGTLPRRLLDTMVKPLWIVQDLPQQPRTLAQDELDSSDGRD
jgi:nucleotide-binding universal stress UspA family protein